MEGQEDWERKLQIQRHDFMNHIQVVYAYLQVGKHEQAIRYLEKMIAEQAAKKENGCQS